MMSYVEIHMNDYDVICWNTHVSDIIKVNINLVLT
jgi:hypothetical protein